MRYILYRPRQNIDASQSLDPLLMDRLVRGLLTDFSFYLDLEMDTAREHSEDISDPFFTLRARTIAALTAVHFRIPGPSVILSPAIDSLALELFDYFRLDLTLSHSIYYIDY